MKTKTIYCLHLLFDLLLKVFSLTARVILSTGVFVPCSAPAGFNMAIMSGLRRALHATFIAVHNTCAIVQSTLSGSPLCCVCNLHCALCTLRRAYARFSPRKELADRQKHCTASNPDLDAIAQSFKLENKLASMTE